MSLINARQYFRTKLKSIGYKEWSDPLNVENIPSTILDKAFHIEHPSIDPISINQQSLDINHRINIKTFYKGFSEPQLAMDKALTELERILQAVMPAVSRLNISNVKNIIFQGAFPRALSQSNDNVVVLELNFVCLTVLDVDS